jgi:CheY-like chemotaxis protein
LPDVDGFEVAARLREAGASSAIILTSSREGSDFGPLIEDSGARGFVAKPELSGDAVRALVA